MAKANSYDDNWSREDVNKQVERRWNRIQASRRIKNDSVKLNFVSYGKLQKSQDSSMFWLNINPSNVIVNISLYMHSEKRDVETNHDIFKKSTKVSINFYKNFGTFTEISIFAVYDTTSFIEVISLYQRCSILL